MPSLTGIYTSPQTNYDDSTAPRIPYGRNPSGRAPYSTIRRVSGPNGEVDSQTDRVPYAPSLPLERGDVSVQLPGTTEPTHMPYGQYANMRNGGQIPRGPSPDVMSIRANAQNPNQSIARGAPVLGPPTGPAPMMGGGSAIAPGYGGAIGGPAPTSPNPFGAAASPGFQDPLQRVGSRERNAARIEHDSLGRRIASMVKTDPGYDDMKRHYDDMTSKLYPNPTAPIYLQPNDIASIFAGSSPSGSPGASQPPTSPNPTPYINPDSGRPQRLAPISPEEDNARLAASRSAPGYEEGWRGVLGTAAKDLDEHPDLGTVPVPPAQAAPLTPVPNGVGNGAGNALAASAQAVGNQGAIQRGLDAKRQKVIDSNAAQIATNQNAGQVISDRSLALDNAKSARLATASAQPTTQPTTQPAGAQAAGGGAGKVSRAVAAVYVKAFGDPQKATEALKQHGFDTSGYAD